MAFSTRLSCVLSGSYRRNPEHLAATFAALRDRFEVLSPHAIDWVDPDDDFVRNADEVGRAVIDVEDGHLDAIRRADFMWLTAPDGYVGLTAAAEIGWARACGVPVYTDTAVADVTVGEMVQVVASFDDLENRITARSDLHPGNGAAAVQAYYARLAARRGWDDETPGEILGHLVEELGELARAVRTRHDAIRHHTNTGGDVSVEIADLTLLLAHLATACGIDLGDAIDAKETVNDTRWSSTHGGDTSN